MSRVRTLLTAAVLAATALLAPSIAAAGPPDQGGVVTSTETWTWKG